MKAIEFLLEHKKSRKAKKYTIKPEKPRNFVAKNAINSGAGAHKDKKKAAKQGDVKHKGKELAEGINAAKIAELENTLSHLEKIYPLVQKVSKENHYVFEQVEMEISSLEPALKDLGNSSEAVDIKSAMDDAVQAVRQANGVVYTLEKTVKDLIRTININIEDAQDEDDFAERFGGANESLEEDVVTERSYASDKNYSQAPGYKHYDIYVSKKKFNDSLGFIAVAEIPRNETQPFKANGKTPAAALEKLRAVIDEHEEKATKVTANATIDFNVDFLRDIREMSQDTFYAKIIPGPKLVIASDEFLEMPELLKDEGFKRSALRKSKTSDKVALPSIPLSAAQAQATKLVANGRYILGSESADRDGNQIFDLNFDSVVQDKNEREFLRAPGFTVGTLRAKA